ncbi:MAG: hypothetical protein K9I99_03775 [Melioribacteraceae bacterium]|nr:hypothetical protein [Melioribacteraceae bacterium]
MLVGKYEVKILNGSSESEELEIGGNVGILAVSFPSAMTGTKITFKVYNEQTEVWEDLYYEEDQVSSVIVASTRMGFDLMKFISGRKYKIVSDASESADRILTVWTGSY